MNSSSHEPIVQNGWKEIATYLGRGVRTVQRWERESGLPVHRPRGRRRSAVLAIPQELNDWLGKASTVSQTRGMPADPARSAADSLLRLARQLLAHGERMRHLDPRHRQELEEKLQSIREIIYVLVGRNDVKTEPMVNPSPRRENARPARLILSVDDETAILFTREKILETAGYEVLSAPRGVSALEIFATHPVDLVLLDYKMPGMDGGIVAGRMKRSKPEVPIIMVTGNTVPPDVRACVDCIVAKGSGPASLLETITQLLDAHAVWLAARHLPTISAQV